jgi:electron transfer flavoprotein alpha subunit
VSSGTAVPVFAIVLADDLENADRASSAAFAAGITGAHETRALVFGRSVSDEVAQSIGAEGVAAVTVIEHSGLSQPVRAGELLPLAEAALRDFGVDSGRASLILTPSGAVGEELAAALAARMGGDALGRCSQIATDSAGISVKRPSFGGRILVELISAGRPAFAVVRRPAEVASAALGGSGIAIDKRICGVPLPSQAHITRRVSDIDRHARLIGARIVIGGGRGMGGPEGFEKLRELASLLDGAFGGSLPTVDAGWVPVAQQIGQSGHYVSADIYVAIGVSGTPQHLAGISPTTKIIAVNKDAHADIFRVAEIGVVGDWKDVVPKLIEELRAKAAA